MSSLINTLRTLAVAALLLLATASLAWAQASGSYALHEESKVWIDGTSNRSDWTVHATEMTGTAALSEDGSTAQELRLSVTSEALVSQKSTIMDRLMHKTLEVDQHPEIVYELTSAEPVEADGPDHDFALETTGQLTIAGTTNDVAMTVQGKTQDDGSVRFTGSHPLSMTDYGLTPPTAMFGALRTGDEVTVHFDVAFVPATADVAN